MSNILSIPTIVRNALAMRRAIWTIALLSLTLGILVARPARAEECLGGNVNKREILLKTEPLTPQPALLVKGDCKVPPGDYFFGAVNILNNGKLTFVEGPTNSEKNEVNFWATSIIIENGGAMRAGVGDDKPFGTNGGKLVVTLYGPDQSKGDPVNHPGVGALCATEIVAGKTADCGIPETKWINNGKTEYTDLPGGVKDFFYQYGGLYGDDAPAGSRLGHFGYKSIGLSYGGVLELRGAKGTSAAAVADKNWTDSGTSWVRLGDNLAKGKKEISLDLPPNHVVADDWKPGDHIVVTSTDYLPTHSEELIIDTISGNKVTVTKAADYDHVGKKFDLTTLLAKGKSRLTTGLMDKDVADSGETRAAVALLTRSIQIVSGGDIAGETFDQATERNKKLGKDYYFGGHTVVRQGFEKLQIQGVEFRQLGQGGVLGHYAVHFHMARKTPTTTYVKDSSMNESMTRWIVIHSTLGVTVARNVGFRSIGHGFLLEDGTETDNKFYSNLGIFARAGVVGPENPRNVPGLIAQNGVPGGNPPNQRQLQYRSDIVHPSVFWITNAWNEFVGNMAVGTGTCGACYWLVPQASHDMVEVDGMGMDGKEPMHMQWSGYSALQGARGMAGTSPLKAFYKNYCSSSMHSFITVGSVAECNGIDSLVNAVPNANLIQPIRGIAPQIPVSDPTKKPVPPPPYDTYYAYITDNRTPTVCDPSLPNANAQSCKAMADRNEKCDAGTAKNCSVTLLDHYTSSFNWAETNFSAIWLRGGWNMIDNSFISDVQNGGVTLISGGDYTRSSAPLGYWTLLSRSVLAGQTQANNSFARASGPYEGHRQGGRVDGCFKDFGNTCINIGDETIFPLSNWGTNQRLFNIYDGPAYQDANAYVSTPVSPCNDDACMYYRKPGIRKDPRKAGEGFLPNAAIGWKQPNGFYYPPAFHSRNLFFENVDIRHYVVEPLNLPGTNRSDTKKLLEQYAGGMDESLAKTAFDNYTDVDRQTELNDDDGSLTGFTNTVSVNEDAFFRAPIQTSECKSNLNVNPTEACAGSTSPTPPTVRTSPYDYVTTVIFPGCAIEGSPGWQNKTSCGNSKDTVNIGPGRFSEMVSRGGTWSSDCAGPFCFGVPIYRQYLTGAPAGNGLPATREWAKWLNDGCTDPKKASTAECNTPFVRMAGTNTYQRGVMTANNSTYYIDTTASNKTQEESQIGGLASDKDSTYVSCKIKAEGKCQPLSVNVFEKGQTYYVFFLFAKKETKQTYQIFVGADFKEATDLKGFRTALKLPIKPELWSLPQGWQHHMISGGDSTVKDVLEITVDFSKLNPTDTGLSLDPAAPSNHACQPASFCSRIGQGCGCNLKDNDPRVLVNPGLKAVCTSTCQSWAMKDLDCPDGNCLGFSFKMGTTPADQNRRPPASVFPSGTDTKGKAWTSVVFQKTKIVPDNAKGGDCFYDDANVPGKGACKVAD